MTRFEHVKEILDRSVNSSAIGAHGAFWRNKTRDQFVQARVFGMPLLKLGKPEDSNIIKAVRAIAPFGSDVGTPNALYRRMPAGKQPLKEEDIAFIEQWISDNCPDDEWTPAPIGAVPQGMITDQQINAYFRALDNWALFQATDEVQEAVGTFFNTAAIWFKLAQGKAPEIDWTNALAVPDAQAAISVLGSGQEVTARQFFGNPMRSEELATAYERFGAGSLPQDPLRPQRDHRMDGEVMWFIWLAFAEAARNLGREAIFWDTFSRAILIGMMNDGIFRGRFTVNGFPANAASREAIRTYIGKLTSEQIITEGRKRFFESGVGA